MAVLFQYGLFLRVTDMKAAVVSFALLAARLTSRWIPFASASSVSRQADIWRSCLALWTATGSLMIQIW